MNDFNIPITIGNIEPTELDYIQQIREDVKVQLQKTLSSGDVRSHLLVSIIGSAVFVTCLVEDESGNFRYESVTPESMYEMYKLKEMQYSVDKGAWVSVLFRSDSNGFVESTQYNYTRKLFTGETPEEWFIAPEDVDETVNFFDLDEDADTTRVAVWSLQDYADELERFPRNDGSTVEAVTAS